MAVPKRKMSKARRDRRRANWKLEAPGYVACPQCHEPKCLIMFALNVVIMMVKKLSLLQNNFLERISMLPL